MNAHWSHLVRRLSFGVAFRFLPLALFLISAPAAHAQESWTQPGPIGPTASLIWSDSHAYFMRGGEYLRYDIAAD